MKNKIQIKTIKNNDESSNKVIEQENQKTKFEFFIFGGDSETRVSNVFNVLKSSNQSNLSSENETSLDDGKGGRITLDNDDDNIVKK